MIATLVTLAILFAELSLIGFGGGNTVLPEMQRRVVEVQHWMSAADFGALFALAQAAPGPNLMVVPLIGWHVAGLPGLLVSALAKFAPSSLITCFAYTLWERFRDRPWRAIVLGGLQPMTTGLVAASAFLITTASATNPLLLAIAIGAAVLTAATRVHPLLVLAAGAMLGMILLG